MSTVKRLKITLGTDNFKEMVTEYDIFVDKTLLVKEIIESDEKAILITYPRRWGKTLNLDMLRTFFAPEQGECQEKWSYQQQERSHEPGLRGWLPGWQWFYAGSNHELLESKLCSRDIFTGGIFFISEEKRDLKPLLIANVDNGKYMRYQGKYPVIFISLKDIVAYSLDEIKIKLKYTIKSLYREHLYLAESTQLEEYERMDFKKYISQGYDEIVLEEGVKLLSKFLWKHHGKKVYVLVDEYDKPVNFLLEDYLAGGEVSGRKTVIEKVAQLISYTFCSAISKNNPSLEKLILIGIFDTIQKESGSGCNNVKAFGVTDSKFSAYFGFSENEIRGIVERFDFNDSSKILKHTKNWYNGYTVPVVSSDEYIYLYTPWAVMNYLSDAYREGEDLLPKNYWARSGASTILRHIFSKEKCLDSRLSDKFISLSTDHAYELKFDPQISLFKYDWFSNSNNDEFFSYLLLNSGYLTGKKNNSLYYFNIPNSELLEEFTNIIPEVDGQCSKLLYNFKKTGYLEIIKMIQQKDVAGITGELSNDSLSCEDKSMNFNLLHLAAIFGNGSVFETLFKFSIEKRCSFSTDRFSELNEIDYMFLVKNNDAMAVFQNYDYQGRPINQYELVESCICSTYRNMVAPVVFTDRVNATKSKAVSHSVKGTTTELFINILNGTLLSAGKQPIAQYCNDYLNYQVVDISNPSGFDSLKQFEMYLLGHPNAQVVLNEQQCPDSWETLSKLNYNIFESSFYSDQWITFTLCAGALGESAYGNPVSDEL